MNTDLKLEKLAAVARLCGELNEAGEGDTLLIMLRAILNNLEEVE